MVVWLGLKLNCGPAKPLLLLLQQLPAAAVGLKARSWLSASCLSCSTGEGEAAVGLQPRLGSWRAQLCRAAGEEVLVVEVPEVAEVWAAPGAACADGSEVADEPEEVAGAALGHLIAGRQEGGWGVLLIQLLSVLLLELLLVLTLLLLVVLETCSEQEAGGAPGSWSAGGCEWGGGFAAVAADNEAAFAAGAATVTDGTGVTSSSKHFRISSNNLCKKADRRGECNRPL